ncbi:hypothetical protein HK105_200256 [Polyrhizophydium stewartii]|uniref:Kinase n=1 Tax=Polyrhizophydium stewartii TaxID=2732419 RepID=A0ABR4NL57_9FUNG|nr:hypothetical protein HK105_006348 [Polyrhizophydium stewartii]
MPEAPSAFEHQVAGHAGTLLALGDGRVAKQATAIETAFYQQAPVRAPGLAEAFMPPFLGLAEVPFGDATATALVMGDVLDGFERPCIADIKLGVRLYGDEATAEKRERMEHQARSTTSGATGLRVCGMKVFDPTREAFDVYDRRFGRAITAEQLGIAVDVLLGVLVPEPGVTAPHGPHGLVPAASEDARRHARAVCQRLIGQLGRLRETLAASPVRLYGASALVVYEGMRTAGAPRTDVRLIDFVHSKFVDDADGPDTGALFGVDNLLGLVRDALVRLDGAREP